MWCFTHIWSIFIYLAWHDAILVHQTFKCKWIDLWFVICELSFILSQSSLYCVTLFTCIWCVTCLVLWPRTDPKSIIAILICLSPSLSFHCNVSSICWFSHHPSWCLAARLFCCVILPPYTVLSFLVFWRCRIVSIIVLFLTCHISFERFPYIFQFNA